MDSDFIEIDLGLSLDDSELDFYSFISKDNLIKLKIITWNKNILEVDFLNPVLFTDKFYGFLTKFGIRKNANKFNQTLKEVYDEIPKDHPYKLFQFLSFGEEVSIEIICADYTIKKHIKN